MEDRTIYPYVFPAKRLMLFDGVGLSEVRVGNLLETVFPLQFRFSIQNRAISSPVWPERERLLSLPDIDSKNILDQQRKTPERRLKRHQGGTSLSQDQNGRSRVHTRQSALRQLSHAEALVVMKNKQTGRRVEILQPRAPFQGLREYEKSLRMRTSFGVTEL